MLKKVIGILVLFCLLTMSQTAGDDQKDLWQQAVSEKNLEAKFKMLEDYKEKYAKKENKTFRFLYIRLTDSAYRLRKYEKAIEYGEKSLGFDEIENNNKLILYFYLANSFYVCEEKRNLEKAYKYADLVISLAESLLGHAKSADFIKKGYIAPALRIQLKILYATGKDDIEKIKEAINKGIKAYGYDKSDKSAEMVFGLAIKISKTDHMDYAIEAIENVFDVESPNPKHAYALGGLYYKNGNRTKSVDYFEQSYRASKKDKSAANTALKIGQLLSKSDKERAIKYFAEAYILLDSDKESKAFKYLQHIWFNVEAKDKSPEEKEEGFKEIITAAKERLKLEFT